MHNVFLVAGVISISGIQPATDGKPLKDLLLRAAGILEESMTKEEKLFLNHIPLSCTVQWLQLKKRQVFSGREYDDLCNDPIFWGYANKHYKIAHAEEFFFATVCVVYYHRLNEKNWDSPMCFDSAAALLGVSRKNNSPKKNAQARR